MFFTFPLIVLAKSVSKFVHRKCNDSKERADACLYNVHLRNELKNNLIDDLNKNNYLNDIRKVNIDSNYEVEVVTNYGKALDTFNSFNWLNVTNLLLTNRTNGKAVPIRASCRSSCDFCRAQLVQSRNRSTQLLSSGLTTLAIGRALLIGNSFSYFLPTDSLQSPLTGDLSSHRTWAITASILSTLGLIIVLICVLYFILIFPIALGTTIIGYQILIGLFFCYLVNFAYLLPSTSSLCWVREFGKSPRSCLQERWRTNKLSQMKSGLPIAYSVILSGLFVKVYNYWCQVRMKKSTKPLAYNSPMTLLSISFLFVVIQVALVAVLTYKFSANYGAFANTLKCRASNQFYLVRPETLFPLLLLAVLFGLILFFSVKTVENLESRWILICSVLTALTWLAWIAFDLFCNLISIFPLRFLLIHLLFIQIVKASPFQLLWLTF